jgi:hypothetical protein
MNYPISGTFDELMDVVPTKVLSIMVLQKRDDAHVFTIDVQNGFLMVW